MEGSSTVASQPPRLMEGTTAVASQPSPLIEGATTAVGPSPLTQGSTTVARTVASQPSSLIKGTTTVASQPSPLMEGTTTVARTVASQPSSLMEGTTVDIRSSEGMPSRESDVEEIEDVEHPRRVVSGLQYKSAGHVTSDKIHHVFMTSKSVSRKATTDDFIRLNLSDFDKILQPLINQTFPTLDLSIPAQSKCADELFTRFKREYVPEMDKKLSTLIGVEFNSRDEILKVLNMVLRSYVRGFSVHPWRTRKRCDGSSRSYIQCHTRKHTKTVSSDSQKSKCPWSVHIDSDQNGVSKIVHIDSLSVHTFDCFCCQSKTTPSEVSFQCNIPPNHVDAVMTEFRQSSPRKPTIYKRRYRAKAATEALIDNKFLKELEGREINDSISNCKEIGVRPDQEVSLILRYLSSLHDDKELETFVTFGESGVSTTLHALSINLMWKEGKQLLSTHADVIFCDSMWNVSLNGYYVLTIVVVDKNYDLHLAALSLVSQERKDSWASFFTWVKSVVPSFSPKCIVTDGALYIDDGFKEAIGRSVGRTLHIVCWWHRHENVMNKIGIKQEFSRVLLRMAYASSKLELQHLKQQADRIASKDLQMLASESYKKLIADCSKSALISLKVFTGGTVTNSYSESINSILRSAGLKPNFPLLTVLRFLDNFSVQHNCDKHHQFPSNWKYLSVLDEEVQKRVSVGALCRLKKRVQKVINNCTLKSFKEGHAYIKQRVPICYEEFLHLRLLRVRKRRFTKHVCWKVDWSREIPVCSCNAPTYSGMPCAHILFYAFKVERKVPLECFHPRFRIDSDILQPSEQGNASEEQPSVTLSETADAGVDMVDEDTCPVLSQDFDDCEEMETHVVCKVRKLELETLDEIIFYKDFVNLVITLSVYTQCLIGQMMHHQSNNGFHWHQMVLFLHACHLHQQTNLKKRQQSLLLWMAFVQNLLLVTLKSNVIAMIYT